MSGVGLLRGLARERVLMVDRPEKSYDFYLEYLAPYSRTKLLEDLKSRARAAGYRLEREIPLKGFAVENRLAPGDGKRTPGARPVWYWYAYPLD